MKKILLVSIFAILLSSCGTGSYSVSSGKSDEALLSFAATEENDIKVSIDNGDPYSIKTVKEVAYKKKRQIKQTALNSITISPGTHTLKVEMGENEVLNTTIFISASEHRIIKL